MAKLIFHKKWMWFASRRYRGLTKSFLKKSCKNTIVTFVILVISGDNIKIITDFFDVRNCSSQIAAWSALDHKFVFILASCRRSWFDVQEVNFVLFENFQVFRKDSAFFCWWRKYEVRAFGGVTSYFDIISSWHQLGLKQIRLYNLKKKGISTFLTSSVSFDKTIVDCFWYLNVTDWYLIGDPLFIFTCDFSIFNVRNLQCAICLNVWLRWLKNAEKGKRMQNNLSKTYTLRKTFYFFDT